MDVAPDPIERFIIRWDGTENAERANKDNFLSELCDALSVPRPDPASGHLGDYRFERNVTHYERDGTQSAGRIDLYKRRCFVLEAKQDTNRSRQIPIIGNEADYRANVRQGGQWLKRMLEAKGQAEAYAKALPVEEGWPPFLIVCDIGFCFDLYADFSGTGKHYAQFPDRDRFRVYLPELRDESVRNRLRAIWLDPQSLDPSRVRMEVTREIAALLAKLARKLEARGHAPEAVATFLIRCIFCMFAQSAGLLPKPDTLSVLLQECEANVKAFPPLLGEFWRVMNTGGFSTTVRADLRHFNGGLFAPGIHGAAEPLPVNADELKLLRIAAGKDWSNVEPAIFGTLLENALDPAQRDEWGAHFTPRAFVERLVLPTVMEPLRADWDSVKAAATAADDTGRRDEAARLVGDFHARLANTRVLDPACGTGNFLYVCLELMKRLEGEVLDLLATLRPGEGDRFGFAGASVDPHNFLGLEKNPRAVPVAELVLWIGWLQWHARTSGGRPPPEPILRDFRTIEHRDALLDSKGEREVRDKAGQLMTRWDGRTRKRHPVTGEMVPDENARSVVMRLVGGKAAAWPEADFIVGNPPFGGGKDLRADLGEGYAEALWAAYDKKVPKSADLAMYFWWKGAQAVASGKTRRCGFITSNSLRQAFNRRVVAAAMEARKPVHLAFAIPDHPWADGKGCAAVRIAMSVIARGRSDGRLLTVVEEGGGEVPEVRLREERGRLNADLTVGVATDAAKELTANARIASPGVKLHGEGFIVTPAEARALGLGRLEGLQHRIRLYRNGRDLTSHSRDVMVIDMFGLTADEVRRSFPAAFQHLLNNVKPDRDANSRSSYRENWWIFGEPRSEWRAAVAGLPRYIATVETAKHRVFQFLPTEIVPDNRIVCVATSDAFHLGVLSSRSHIEWALATGGLLEDRPVYNKTLCFDPFPMPEASPRQRAEIASLAEELDAHRKRVLAARTHLTLTGLYNVRDALRAGRALTEAERDIHEAGEVSLIAHLHDRIDAAVAAAYGWPVDLPAAEIVARVVALNAERRAEEAEGHVRWLRPEFQAPAETRMRRAQAALDIAPEETATADWPGDAPAQFLAVRRALAAGPCAPSDVARQFTGAPARRLGRMLETLAALGQARKLPNGRYAA